MPSLSLAEFVEELQREGELARVGAEVDAEFEAAEITRRVSQQQGPALLFERVRGQRWPVVTNLLGTERRICLALGIDALEQIDERLGRLPSTTDSGGWLGRLRGTAASAQGARLVKTGACQQVVRLGSDIDLADLPALHGWPGESHRSITGGLVVTTDPRTGWRHVVHHDLAVLDRNLLGLSVGPHDPLEQQLAAARQQGGVVSVAVTLGGDAGYRCLAAIPRLVSCDPWNWAGALLERMVELVKCRSQDEHVPADVEMVLEGTIDPNTARHPGVVLAGDAGYCSTAVAVPVMKVTAITHRANPLFPAVIQGPVPHEGTALGWLTERTLLAQLSELLPEVVDIALPAAGGCRSLAFVALRKQLPREGRRIAGALWALAPQVGTKLLVLVDAGVDVHNSEEVMSRVGNNVHPARDVFTQEMSAGLLGHASPAIGLGERLGIDATDKLPGEHPLDWPRPTRATDEVALLVSRRWQEYGFRPSDNSPG